MHNPTHEYILRQWDICLIDLSRCCYVNVQTVIFLVSFGIRRITVSPVISASVTNHLLILLLYCALCVIILMCWLFCIINPQISQHNLYVSDSNKINQSINIKDTCVKGKTPDYPAVHNRLMMLNSCLGSGV